MKFLIRVDIFKYYSLNWKFSVKADFKNEVYQKIVFSNRIIYLLNKLPYQIKNRNHHHVMPLARIFLTFSRHFSLSFITSGRSSGLHPISSHSCCMYVQAGCPAFAWPYVGVHKSTSFMSLSLLLQQCPACLVCLTWIVFVMGGRWPYSWCLRLNWMISEIMLKKRNLRGYF